MRFLTSSVSSMTSNSLHTSLHTTKRAKDEEACKTPKKGKTTAKTAGSELALDPFAPSRRAKPSPCQPPTWGSSRYRPPQPISAHERVSAQSSPVCRGRIPWPAVPCHIRWCNEVNPGKLNTEIIIPNSGLDPFTGA